MADAVSHTSKPPKSPAHHVTSANNPGKFYIKFLYKAALFTVFLVVLQISPSVAPDFINQTLRARNWEFLQLIFVGIAVSYGLFSQKNDETEKDHGGARLDNAQSYVSKFLQVSSVFDDEFECSEAIIEENNKVETLRSKYYKGKPVVVLAKQSPAVVKQGNGCEITQKPLLLPVRSLIQRLVPEANEFDLGDKSGGKTNQSRCNSSSRKPRNVEAGGLSSQKMEKSFEEILVELSSQKMEKSLEENLVLHSPIPWRSRSGRMEMKENEEDEEELKGIDESKYFRSKSDPNSSSLKNSFTPKKLPPSTSFPSKSQAVSGEDDDVVRKTNYFASLPPPIPPTSMLSKPDLIFTDKIVSPKEEELCESEMEELLRNRVKNDGLAKPVRTYKSSELEKKSMDFYEMKKWYTDMMSDGELPKEEFVEMMETSDEDAEAESSEEEEDFIKGTSSGNGEVATYNNNNSVNDVGPDVDKKAEEFIAKFREQIRLQRIQSFRRSTAQHAGKALR